jgi:hypothetical protein
MDGWMGGWEEERRTDISGREGGREVVMGD